MTSRRNAVASSSSSSSNAVPFSIPLHFGIDRSAHTCGPRLPRDWRQTWHATEDEEVGITINDDLSDVPEEKLWPDVGLQRWVTCMTSWDVEADEADEKKTTNEVDRFPSPPTISVADEKGSSVSFEEEDAQRKRRRKKVKLGNTKSARRIAIGTQDGNVWIFQESEEQRCLSSEPLSPSSSVDSRKRTPSQSSYGLNSPTFRTSMNNHAHRDTMTSPTSPSVGMSGINASAATLQMTGDMDAEEKLEMQWHAGESKTSMMSGMMEALGLQHQNHSHEHVHHEHSRKASAGSASKRLSRTNHDRKNQTAPGTPERRIHNESYNVKRSERSMDMVPSLSARLGQGTGTSLQEEEGTDNVLRKRTQGTIDADEAQGGVHDAHLRPTNQQKLRSMEPLLSLQCPAPLPIVSLCIRYARNGDEMLVILQEDGRLATWTLGETLQVHTMDLKSARVPIIELEHAEPTSQQAGTSPLARFAALRSQAGTPTAPRSRTGSNASRPEDVTFPGISKFLVIPIVCQSSDPSADHFLVCFDATQKRVYAVDCARHALLAHSRLADMSETSTPCSQLQAGGEHIEVIYVNSVGAVVTQPLRIKAKIKAHVEPEARFGPLSSASAFLRREGISQPASRAASRPASVHEDTADDSKELGDTGIVKHAKGLLLLPNNCLASWHAGCLSLAKRVGDSLVAMDSVSLTLIMRVSSSHNTLTVQTKSRLEQYNTASGKLVRTYQEDLMSVCEAYATGSPSCVFPMVCYRDAKDCIDLRYGKQSLWKGKSPAIDTSSDTILACLPFSMERIVVSLSSGHLIMCSLADLVDGRIPSAGSRKHHHMGTIALLQVIVTPKSKTKLVFGGTKEGDVLIWSASTLDLLHESTLLNSPLVGFIGFGDQDNVLRLHNCVACISADGAVAVVSLDDFQLVYLIPGRDAPLHTLAVRSNELLVSYADGRARVWDMQSGEMRRSIAVEQAIALINDGKGWWSTFKVDGEHLRREKGAAGVLSSVPSSRAQLAGSMTADIRRVVEATSRMVAPVNVSGVNNARDLMPSANGDDLMDSNTDATALLGSRSSPKPHGALSLQMPQARKALHTLRPILRCLLPQFKDLQEYDDLVRRVLDVGDTGSSNVSCSAFSIASGTFSEPGFLAIGVQSNARDEQLLCVSSALTTMRLVAAIAVLIVLSNIYELHDAAQELIIVLGSLHDSVGTLYYQPTMSVLTAYMTDPTLEVKQAAQTLFVSSLESMPQEDLDAVCQEYGDALPSRQTRHDGEAGNELGEGEEEEEAKDQEEESLKSKALLLLGLIATQRYTDLAPGLLKDIASSISSYLEDEGHPSRRSVAIALCDRGFSIFQHYFDAMEILRTLFSLSTMLKERDAQATTSEIENRDLSRQAVLRIAEENTPLFMTTLSLDILHARSPEHCSATMRLVAFMVRRKPLVLYPNLPRLAEAVIKSLDPTITSLRAVVHRSATIIISELIAAYPTIAFHKGLQRLAVGTFEGAIIMYDLKTATRLYVLEAHSTSLNGLIFSDDGRRLISICLGDGKLKVWKTGVGIGSIFSFGSAPRQVGALLGRATGVVGLTDGSASPHEQSHSQPSTHGGTPPYKTFDFGRMAASALASVRMRRASASPLTSPTSGTSLKGAPTTTTSMEREAAFLSDLSLVRLEWLAERSIRIRIGEANLVFDVA